MPIRILYKELDALMTSTETKTTYWNANIEALAANTQRVIDLQEFQGQAAESIKHYLQEVHFTIIWALSDIITELMLKELIYYDGYIVLDSALHTVISETILDNILHTFHSSKDDYINTHIRLRNALDDISDIIPLTPPTAAYIDNDYETILRDQTLLRDNIINHETNHRDADFSDLDTLFTHLQAFLSEALSKDRTAKSTYQSGDIVSYPSFAPLVQTLQTTEERWKTINFETGPLADAAQRRAVRQAAAQREDDGTFQIITSILEIAGGIATIVSSIGAIVSTFGAGTPLGIIGIIGGVGMILHGSSNLEEGIHMRSLGRAGNMTDSPHSWLRDEVMAPLFGEENKQTAFNIFGYASMALGMVGGMGSAAIVQAAKTGTTITLQLTRMGLTAFTGIAAGKGSGWVAGQLGASENTRRYVELIGGFVGAGAAYKGLQSLPKTAQAKIKPIPQPSAPTTPKNTPLNPVTNLKTTDPIKQCQPLKTQTTENQSIKCQVGEPVDPICGIVFYDLTDFEYPGPLPLKWERSWSSRNTRTGPFGYGSSSPFSMYIEQQNQETNSPMVYINARGREIILPPSNQENTPPCAEKA